MLVIAKYLNELARRRAKAGATYMDATVPGWAQQIDRDELDLSCCWNCLLGQLYQSYPRGVSALDLTNKDTVRLGFDTALLQMEAAPIPEVTLEEALQISARRNAYYASLTRYWLAEIDARLNVVVAEPALELAMA